MYSGFRRGYLWARGIFADSHFLYQPKEPKRPGDIEWNAKISVIKTKEESLAIVKNDLTRCKRVDLSVYPIEHSLHVLYSGI